MLRWLKRRRRPQHDHVFLNSQDKAWNSPGFAAIFRRAARTAEIKKKISPYSLRHGFCVRGIENGVGSRQIADLMGHTTTRYVDWYGRATRSRVNHLRNVLGQINKRDKK